MLKEQRKIASEKKLRKNELKSLGKPKRFLSAFMLYALDKIKNSNLKPKDIKDEWANLNDDQKQAYILKAKQLQDKYE